MGRPVKRFAGCVCFGSVGAFLACIDVSGLRSEATAAPADALAPTVPDATVGPCDGAVCGPVAITTNEIGLTVDVALSAEHVFFDVLGEGTGKVVRCAKEGGCAASRREIVSDVTFAGIAPRMTVARDSVYFALRDGASGLDAIRRCAIDGCVGPPEAVSPPAKITSRGFFVDGDAAYYGVDRDLHRVPLPGLPYGAGDVVLATAATPIAGIAGFGDDLYFSEPDYEGGGVNGRVSRLPKTGGSPVEVARMKWASRAVAASYGVIVGPYPPDPIFGEPGDLAVFAGLTRTTLYSGNDAFTDIAADDTTVFFTTKVGELRANGRTSPSSAVRTIVGHSPLGVAVDGTSVYAAFPRGIPGAATPSVYRFVK